MCGLRMELGSGDGGLTMQFSVGVFGLPPAGIGACCAPCGNGLPCVGPRYVPSNRAIGEVPVNTYTVQRSDSLSLIT